MSTDIEVNYENYTFLSDNQMGGRMKLGKYEVEEIKLLELIPDINRLSVLELGGCLGVVSVILNKKLDNPEKHIVIEANPKLIKYLEHNKKINNCSFSIKNALLTSNKENNIFYSYDKLVAGSAHRLDDKESNKTKHIVNTIPLEELKAQTNYNFDLCRLAITIIDEIKYVLVELHENLMYPGFNQKCINELNQKGFTIINSIGNSILLKK